jgi:cytochrome d ubiquinol oxidase subunit I
MDALAAHRFQFAFTVTYHYLFPQLTMGLALLIVVLKGVGLRAGPELAARANEAARFWVRVFALGFVMGVVTGIPLEFQFGTNWARFSTAAGGIISQTLAMEGVFAFVLESAFLGLLVYGEQRLGPRLHFGAALMVCIGTWLSGWFIVVTNAFMQHPVGYEQLADGSLRLASLWAYLTNPWAFVQYAHTMVGSVLTASFVMCGVGAYYALMDQHREHAALFLRVGVIAGAIASVAIAMPTGDMQARLVSEHKPVTFAAMEGHFDTEDGAGLVMIGQPNMETLHLDNPVVVPRMLSVMTHQRWGSRIEGLREYPREEWPDNVPLLYYAYHVMVGLGTLFMALMGVSAFLLYRKKLLTTRPVLIALMLRLPVPVHRQHRRLDDRRAGPPAVAHPRAHAHGRRHVAGGVRGQRAVHPAGLHGALRAAVAGVRAHLPAHPAARAQRGPRRGGALMLEVTWFFLAALPLVAYTVLDGFDLGVGILHHRVARTDAERKQVLASIGPVWDGNEVWLVVAGATLFLAFPVLFGVAFSGFYLPLTLVLWLLVFRALGIELRHLLPHRLFNTFWDASFTGASALLAFALGAALGNVVRGVSLDDQGQFFAPLWTDLWWPAPGVPGQTGVVDAYTLLTGLTAVVVLALHGALWLAHRVEGVVAERAQREAREVGGGERWCWWWG